MLQLLLFSGLAFFICLPLMKRTLTVSLDVDWFYRKFFSALGKEFTNRSSKAHGNFMSRVENRLQRPAPESPVRFPSRSVFGFRVNVRRGW